MTGSEAAHRASPGLPQKCLVHSSVLPVPGSGFWRGGSSCSIHGGPPLSAAAARLCLGPQTSLRLRGACVCVCGGGVHGGAWGVEGAGGTCMCVCVCACMGCMCVGCTCMGGCMGCMCMGVHGGVRMGAVHGVYLHGGDVSGGACMHGGVCMGCTCTGGGAQWCVCMGGHVGVGCKCMGVH